MAAVHFRAETNTRFARKFAQLHTLKVFGYAANNFGEVILAYLKLF